MGRQIARRLLFNFAQLGSIGDERNVSRELLGIFAGCGELEMF